MSSRRLIRHSNIIPYLIETTPGGLMSKREPQIILKTDERSIHLELGRDENSPPNQAVGMKAGFREGDKLEVAVKNGRPLLTHLPGEPRPAVPVLLPGRIVAPSQRPATPLRCAVTRCGRRQATVSMMNGAPRRREPNWSTSPPESGQSLRSRSRCSRTHSVLLAAIFPPWREDGARIRQT